MKILIAITKSNYGGAQRYVYDMATELSKRHDVAVLFGGSGLLAEKLSEAKIRTISISELGRDVSASKDVPVFFRILKILKHEKPDALILNSSKMGGIGSLAGRIARIKKIIFVAHGFAWNENRNVIEKLAIWLSYSLTTLFSGKIVAVSEGIADEAKRLPFTKNKIALIRHGVAGARYFLDRNSARQALGIREDAFAVGTIAELHPIKGLTYAIDAVPMVSVPDFEYVVLGEGEARGELEKQITENKLGKKVFLKGFVKDAATYLKAFDIFLLPSLSEALGYVLLEAGQAEIPTVATDVGGIPEIIKDEETGLLIRSKNPKEIANAIRVLHEDKTKALTLAKNLHQSITLNFSLEKEIAETEKLITG